MAHDMLVIDVLVFAAVAGGKLCAWIAHRPDGFEAWRVRRRYRSATVTTIAELAELTLGRIAGRVAIAEQTLTAPLSGRPCVHYTVVVWIRRGQLWETCAAERHGVRFVIADRTGRAIVDPTDAEIAPDFDHTESLRGSEPTPAQAALLARHGVERRGMFVPRRLRFREAVIAVGDRVGVTGAGVRELDPAARVETGYRTAAPTLLRIAGSPQAPLSIVWGPRR